MKKTSDTKLIHPYPHDEFLVSSWNCSGSWHYFIPGVLGFHCHCCLKTPYPGHRCQHISRTSFQHNFAETSSLKSETGSCFRDWEWLYKHQGTGTPRVPERGQTICWVKQQWLGQKALSSIDIAFNSRLLVKMQTRISQSRLQTWYRLLSPCSHGHLI